MTVKYTGVNLAGLEFGSGLASNQYVSNGEDHYEYWANEVGANIVRVPFKWERLQNEKFSDLDETYFGYLKDAVEYGREHDLVVVLDMHNYARAFGSEMAYDDSLLAAYQDVWRELANEFKDDPHVWFNIMNEPHGISADRWMEFAQAATDTIRATGATNKLIVPTVDWSGAHEFNKSSNRAKEEAYERYVDPGGNFAFEVHQYLDYDNSGRSPFAVSGKGANVLEGATDWARQNGYELFLGEFGVSYDGGSNVEAEAMLQYMADNSDVYLGWTAWAAGEWWGDYIYGLGRGYEDTNILRPFINQDDVDHMEDAGGGAFSGGGTSAGRDDDDFGAPIADESVPSPSAPILAPSTPAPENIGDDQSLQPRGFEAFARINPPADEGYDLTMVLAAVDPASDLVLTRIEPGSTLDASMFNSSGINLKANVFGVGMEDVRSVRITTDDGDQHLETVRPYAVFGDDRADYFSGGLEEGLHRITVQAYDNEDGVGVPLMARTFEFVTTAPIAPDATSLPFAAEDPTQVPGMLVLALVDADTDEVIQRIWPGDTVDLGVLKGGSPAIKANVFGIGTEDIQSLKITLDGEMTMIDAVRPFALFGDERGDYFAGALSQGARTIEVEAFTSDDATGAPSLKRTFDFTVVGDPDDQTLGDPYDINDGLLELLLVDVETGAVLADVNNGASVSVAGLTSSQVRFEARLNDAAAEADQVESVTFAMNGPVSSDTKVQNVPGYVFDVTGYQGANGGNLAPGTYSAKLAAFSQDGGNGAKLDEESFTFTLNDDLFVA